MQRESLSPREDAGWLMLTMLVLTLLGLTWSSLSLTAVGMGDLVRVSGLLGGTVKLPCDTSPPSPHNPLLLTVWFKDQIQDPIYRYCSPPSEERSSPTFIITQTGTLILKNKSEKLTSNCKVICWDKTDMIRNLAYLFSSQRLFILYLVGFRIITFI